MYTKIPVEWRTFEGNVTIEELNDLLVELHIPTIIFIAILMVVGVFGNILVVYIYTTKYHSSTHRCFILWLAWIDLIACTVGMPLLIVSMLYPYMFPSVEACKTLRFLHVFFVVSSAFIVITIAIERHRRICFPFSREMSTRKIKLMCLAASFLGCLVAIPAILVYGDATVETGVQNITGKECFIDPKYVDSSFPKLYFMSQLLMSLISMVILGIFYFRIGRKIWFHHQFIRENTYSHKTPSTMDSEKGKSTEESDVERESKVATDDGDKLSKKSTGNSKNGSAKSSRESTPTRNGKELDKTISKEDPYGDLMKKVVRIKEKSRSNSPAPSSKQSTLKSKNGKSRPKLESSTRSEKCSKAGPSLRTRQVTTMLFIITIVFLLSFLPHLILMVVNSMKKEMLEDLSPASVAVYNLFLRTFVINNMANPIIYGFCDKKFRNECADLAMAIVSCGRK